MTTIGRLFAALLCISVIAAAGGACSSGDDDDEPQPTNTAVADNDGTPTAEPDDEADPTATADEEDGESGDAPTFSDGGWTGGEAQIVVTSAAQVRTLSGPLSTRSKTEPGTTRLTYTSGLDTILFSISTRYEAFAVSVYKESDGFDASSAFEHPCEATYQSAEDNLIEATFRCENIAIGSFNHRSEAPATFEGSLIATR